MIRICLHEQHSIFPVPQKKDLDGKKTHSNLVLAVAGAVLRARFPFRRLNSSPCVITLSSRDDDDATGCCRW